MPMAYRGRRRVARCDTAPARPRHHRRPPMPPHPPRGALAGSSPGCGGHLPLPSLPEAPQGSPLSIPCNALCERLSGTLRRECLDLVIPLSEHHLRCLLKEWVLHYNYWQSSPRTSAGGCRQKLPMDRPGGNGMNLFHNLTCVVRCFDTLSILRAVFHPFALSLSKERGLGRVYRKVNAILS